MPEVDWSAAIRYARLVNIAYEVAPADPYDRHAKSAISDIGFEFIDTLYGNELPTDVSPHQGKTVTYGFLAKSAQGELVAAIRGTETILEWLHDGAFLLVPNPIDAGGGMTEDGFSVVYRSLRLGASADSPPAISGMKGIVGAAGISKLTITGHSLGAALATLLGLGAARNSGAKKIAVYTFASPRVGEQLFRLTYNSAVPETYRFFNQPDIIAQVPHSPYEPVGNGVDLTPPPDVVKSTFGCWHSLNTYLWLMDRRAGGNTVALDAGCRGPAYLEAV